LGISRLSASALATLVAVVMERSRALQKQYQAEAARQLEQLRTAVLDSLAHKFKTPLTVIRTACSGLPAAGELSEMQHELVSMIDQETRTLDDLASRLVGAPAPDATDFLPQPEPLLFSRLIGAAIEEREPVADRSRFRVEVAAPEPPVFADRELILTALAQLVDNAVKYSTPGSPIDVHVAAEESAVVLSVRTMGLVVAAADQERIFERFYRAPDARRRAAGTGLGLSIARTIAADHNGKLWAEGKQDVGTVFWFSLPRLSDGGAA